MKKYVSLSVCLLLSACATTMSPGEFVQATENCETANEAMEAQVACVNDFLLTRNADSREYDVYYTWVKERNAIMELHANGGLNRAQTKLALLDAQNKYNTILLNRDMRNIAALSAMDRHRPIICDSYRVGADVRTICD